MKPLRDKVITVRLDDIEWQMLEDLAKEYEINKSVLIRALILNQWKMK